MIHFICFLLILLGIPIYVLCWVIHNIWATHRENSLDPIQSFEKRNLKYLLSLNQKAGELSDEINTETVDIGRKVQCAKECLALFDSLWSFCSETEAGKQWFQSVASEHCHQAQEALIDYSSRFNKLQEFHCAVFPVSSPDAKIQSDWEIIPCDHNSYDQLVRQKRSIRTVPIFIDHKFLTGLFLSSEMDTVYHVSLFSCDCQDFQKRCLPCKHMYRLFYELTVGTKMSSTFILPDAQSISLKEFPGSNTADLIRFARSLMLSPDTPRATIRTPQLTQYIVLGFLQQLESISDADYYLLLDQITKDEILISLRDYGIEDCRQSWSKKKVVDWVIDNHREYLADQFRQYVSVTIPPSLRGWYSVILFSLDASRSSSSDFIQKWDDEFDEFV